MVSLTSHWSHPPTSFKLFSFFHLGSDHVQLIIVLLNMFVITDRWQWIILSQRWSDTKWKIGIYKNKVERRWTDFDGCQLQYILQKWDVYAWWNLSNVMLQDMFYAIGHFIQHKPLIYQEGVNQSLCFNNCIHEKKNTSIFIRLIDSFKKTNNNCIPKL